jgi:hypothetical protein
MMFGHKYIHWSNPLMGYMMGTLHCLHQAHPAVAISDHTLNQDPLCMSRFNTPSELHLQKPKTSITARQHQNKVYTCYQPC